MIAWLDWYHQNISLTSNSSPEQRKQPRGSDSSPGLHAAQILFIGPPVSTLIKFLTAERHLDEGLWIFQNQYSDISSAVNKLGQHNLLRPVADAVHASDPFHLIGRCECFGYSFPPFPLRHNIPQCFLGPALVAFDLLTSKRNKVQPSGLLSYDRESGRLGFLFWMHLRM